MPDEFTNTDEIEIKDAFKDRFSQLTDWDEFKKYSLSFLRRSIRVNTLKISADDLKNRLSNWNLQQVPWCKDGFWIEHKQKERRDIGNLAEHALGYFYTQEAASMIPPVVLDPQENEYILDMAAAPGSKTTQICQMMNNTGLVIANDYTHTRMKPLSINIQRMGISNLLVTLMDGHRFKKNKFDRILLDAPCSGTGTIRKSLKTLQIYNTKMITRLARTQKSLILNAFDNLKPGGTMVYSTCSVEPEEDEEVIDYLLQKKSDATIEAVSLPGLKTAPAITEFNGKTYSEEVKKSIRIWPQDNDTEGFFVCKIHKSN